MKFTTLDQEEFTQLKTSPTAHVRLEYRLEMQLLIAIKLSVH